MISLQNVALERSGAAVLHDVSFEVKPGEFVCVTGENGAGKTALLSLLLALEKPSRGTITIDNVDLSSLSPALLRVYRRGVGIVFEEPMLLPEKTLFENLAFPLRLHKHRSNRIRERVLDLLERGGLKGLDRSYPAELTHGRMRIAEILRAIAAKPKVLLIDEPTSNVDFRTANTIIELLKDIHREGTTVILATRDPGILVKLRARTIDLEKGRVIRDSGRRAAPVSPITA